MPSHLHEAAGVWDSESGAFISESHRRLAEVLHDYDPSLSLVWIPPKNRDATDTKPFAIMGSRPGFGPHIIRYLSDQEMGNPTEVLAWIFKGDTSKHRPGDILRSMEAKERAERLLNMKQQMDEREDQMQFVEYAVSDRSPNFMRHNGKTFRK
jgi:hypothetical protein